MKSLHGCDGANGMITSSSEKIEFPDPGSIPPRSKTAEAAELPESTNKGAPGRKYNTRKKRNPAGGPGSERGYSSCEHTDGSAPLPSPAMGSARARILQALTLGKRLTSADAWREFGSSRLAADVHELRRMGWPIASTWVTVATRHQGMARVVRYHLASVRRES